MKYYLFSMLLLLSFSTILFFSCSGAGSNSGGGGSSDGLSQKLVGTMAFGDSGNYPEISAGWLDVDLPDDTKVLKTASARSVIDLSGDVDLTIDGQDLSYTCKGGLDSSSGDVDLTVEGVIDYGDNPATNFLIEITGIFSDSIFSGEATVYIDGDQVYSGTVHSVAVEADAEYEVFVGSFVVPNLSAPIYLGPFNCIVIDGSRFEACYYHQSVDESGCVSGTADGGNITGTAFNDITGYSSDSFIGTWNTDTTSGTWALNEGEITWNWGAEDPNNTLQ